MPEHSSLVTDHEDEVQAVFEILTSLSHSEIAHILGDVYSIYGWKPTLTTDDHDTPGILVVNQILPEPKSLVIHYYGEDVLTDQELKDRLEKLDHHQLVVIVESAPTDQAVGFARHAPVSILGVGDIAEEIVASSMLDVLRANIPDTDPLLDKYDGLFSQLPEQTETDGEAVDDTAVDGEADESTDDTTDESIDDNDTDGDTDQSADGETEEVVDDTSRESEHVAPTTLSEDAVRTEGEFFGMEHLGHDFVSGDDMAGTLVAIEVFAKEYDITIDPRNFTIQLMSGYSYQGSDGRDIDLLHSIVGQLSSTWKGSNKRSEVPAGGRIKLLLFFDTDRPDNIKSIRYSGQYQFLFSMHWEQLEEETGYDAQHTFSIDMGLSADPSPAKQPELPTDVRSELAKLGYTIVDVE